jgi:hypothetical protein
VKVFWLVLNFGKKCLKISLEVKNNRLGINSLPFLGAIANSRKLTVSFVMAVRLSSRHVTNRLSLDGFLLSSIFEYFSKIS